MAIEGDKTGEAKLGLTIGLEAKIKVDTRVFFVKITLGAEFHAKDAENNNEGIGIVASLFATTEQDKPALGGSIKFTGCALYYTYYAEVSVKDIKSDEMQRKGAGRGGRSRYASVSDTAWSTDVTEKEKEIKKLVTLFKPKNWPDHNKKSSNTGVKVEDIKF